MTSKGKEIDHTYPWRLLVPKGDRSREHVGKRSVGGTRLRDKHNDLLVGSARPLEATRAAHDRKGSDPMRRIDPICRHLQKEHVAVGRSQRPGSARIAGGHIDSYIPGLCETPEMR